MSETKVITGKVRFSYAHVFEPTAIKEGDTKKYSVAILIPKKDKATLKKIEAAVKAATEAGTTKFGGKIPSKLKLPLRDGDEERPDLEEYEGHYFINCSSQTKPAVVDSSLNPILDKAEFYSGCFGRVSINFYAFNSNGNKGVAAGLNNVQKLEDGEKLSGGGSSAEEDFGSGEDDLG